MKRDLGKADEIFDVPAINFFTSGNDYFGSSGSKFRYRISHTDENIVGEIWHEDLCYEKCTVTDKKEDFPLTPDGLTSCIKWLYEKYESTYEAYEQRRKARKMDGREQLGSRFRLSGTSHHDRRVVQ